MESYINLANTILETGNVRGDRTGTGTVSIFGPQLRFDLAKGFPLLTTKKMFTKGIIHELLWFLKGDTNNNSLLEHNVHIWDEWSLSKEYLNFGENFDTRRIVYVEPIIKEYTDYHNPNSKLSEPISNDNPDDMLRNQWFRMMDRCYNKQAHNYKWYGAKGVFVDPRWHNLQTFIDDVKELPNWKYKLENWNDYNLDKDYYSSNCYSRETCVWLSKKENGIYGGSNNAMLVISPTGQAELFLSISQASEALNISKSSIHRFSQRMPEILKGNNKAFEGWRFIIFDQPFRFEIPTLNDLGPIYGKQWRSWGDGKVTAKQVLTIVNKYSELNADTVDELTALFKNPRNNTIDQIKMLIDGLKSKPFSRRHIVSAWNVEDLPDESISPQENVAQGRMALAPCHCLFQFYVSAINQNEIAAMIDARGLTEEFTMASIDALDRDMKGEKGAAVDYLPAFLDKHGIPKYKLSCQLYQRSADYLLGVPFNIASYALLTMMIAQCVNMVPGEFIHTFGDCHIYRNHIETYLKEQQMNEPYELPKMWINPEVKNIDEFKFEDFKLIDYKSHGKIEYPISV